MPKKKIGRPSIYTDELAARICKEIADGKSLRTICKPDDMPDMTTIFLWLGKPDKYPNFIQQYAEARAQQADAMVEDMLAIADGNNTSGDYQRDRLRVDTRKWVASKLKPKKYGDYQRQDHEGGVEILIKKEGVDL